MTEQTAAQTGASVRTPAMKSQWRQVLGHYPTGITIITSVGSDGGPVGMVVGTFSSVSEEPPLIGFMPQRSSHTFQEIERHGRFRASVLAAGHEKFCRDFFSDREGRFAGNAWEYNEHGIPRLKDSVAWFDATIHDILPAGDHVLVLGEVGDLGLGSRDGNVPLVFLNGGYGTFTTPQRGFDPDNFGGRLRIANKVTGLVRQLSMELGVECALSTVVGDDVVVLAAADIRSPYVGTSFPFAAPMDPGFAAWAPPDMHQKWLDNGQQLTGQSNSESTSAIIKLTRDQGYSISFGHTMEDTFDTVLSSAREDRGAFLRLWKAFETSYDAYQRDPRPEMHAPVIEVPIFGPDGYTAFELVVSALRASGDEARFAHIISVCRSYGRQITEMIDGEMPASYYQHLTEQPGRE